MTKTLDVFRDYYQYEEIQGADRKKIENNTRSCISEKQLQML